MFFLRNYWALDVPGLVRYSDDAGVSSVPPLGGELPTNPLGRLVLKLYHIVFYNKTIYIYMVFYNIIHTYIYYPNKMPKRLKPWQLDVSAGEVLW